MRGRWTRSWSGALVAALFVLGGFGCEDEAARVSVDVGGEDIGSEGDATSEGVGADGAADTAAAVEIVNPAACPDEVTLATFWRGEWEAIAMDCPRATVCRYAAEACPPGAKPPNRCRCDGPERGLVCDLPWQHCLDTPGPGWQPGAPPRPAPESREPAACPDPLPADPDDPCSESAFDPGPRDCETNGDCPAETPLCLATHYFGSSHGCRCHPVDCLTDADCPAGEACRCGETSNTGLQQEACGGWRSESCSHRCLPAECRSDADCGPNGVCSPGSDICGWEIRGYWCHDPTTDECFSHAECRSVFPTYSAIRCNHVDGAGWRCQQPPMCD